MYFSTYAHMPKFYNWTLSVSRESVFMMQYFCCFTCFKQSTTCKVLLDRTCNRCFVPLNVWNKNADSPSTQQQKVRRLLPAVAQQRAVVTGLLHRIAATTLQSCVHLHLLLPALLQLRVVSLGYAASVFDSCLRHFVYARKHAARFTAWHSLYLVHTLRVNSCRDRRSIRRLGCHRFS